MTDQESIQDRRGATAAAALSVALLALLPFAPGLIAGRSFFFRDLSRQFFPLRRFAAEGLRLGELRYWNPYSHEGAPTSLPPLGYPLDLLQALVPSEAAFSLLLAFHVPLAACGLFALGRHLGASRLGAAAGGLVYALGGFGLSTLNLYVYVQAVAWAPFVVLGLLGARETRRYVAPAAVALAVALSTTGVEIVAQAVLCGLILARPCDFRAVTRVLAVLVLGTGLAAPVLLPLSALVEGSARGAGFPTDVTLAHSVHPITMLQVVIGGLYGDLGNLVERWWGQNFFPRGFPYFLSLYLGAAALALGVTGARARPRTGLLLALLGLTALVASAGRFAGLELVVEGLPWLRRFRFPVKVFFTFHFAWSLLCAFGLTELASPAQTRSTRGFARMSLGLGILLILVPWVSYLAGPLRRYLLSGFFPPELAWGLREAYARSIVGDAALGGAVALTAGILAKLAERSRLSPPRAALLILAIIAADLLRTGAGLNRTVSPAFFDPSEEAQEIARRVKASGGRLFVLDPDYSPRYFAARAERRTTHEVWSFAVLQETLSPDFNVSLEVPTALSPDRTMLVPESRVLPVAEATLDSFPRLVPRLQAAAVSHVLSLDPLDHPNLEPVGAALPARITPLPIYLYLLRGSRPRFEVPGGGRIVSVGEGASWLELGVETPVPTTVVVRDAFAAGWGAAVDGHAAAIRAHQGAHREVAVPAGRHTVRLEYHPPGLAVGAALATVALLALAALSWTSPRAGLS